MAIPHGITGYCTPHHCRCDVCVGAWRAYRAQYNRQRKQGIKLRRPADDTREHLLLLIERGHTIRGIATMTGVSYQTIANVLLCRYEAVHAKTAERILGAALSGLPDGGHLVPKEHAQRLLRAMREAGLSGMQLKRMLGYAETTRWVTLGHGERIRLRSHRRIVVLYTLLARAGRVDPSELIGVPR